ncbi:MAG: cysteine desulfurase [Gammaproteobacteria bacterium]|nr:cysteine desulfurase [Gammaproteobacteria bacterium]
MDISTYRADFPILQQAIKDKPLIYLDNAATTQKPQVVIDALVHYYTHANANVHRGVHALSERATHAYENARTTVKNFINAAHTEEIVFVRGTTEAINLVAQSYGRSHLQAGDEILLTELEHHANIVPWQLVCEQTGAKLRVIPINEAGEINLDDVIALINKRTKLLAVGHISNAIGTINPVEDMIKIAHANQVPVLVDGAQAAPHMPIDVQALDCDFYTLSGHKVFGPTGIGALYAKAQWLEKLPPYQGGGDMISSVSFEKSSYNRPPFKFEAGTPNIAGAIGFATALDYLTKVGVANTQAYEQELLAYATQALSEIPGLRIIGTAEHKASIISFVLDKIHPHDIGTILDSKGIAIRAGHHCAMPLMQHFKVSATARASLAFYNTRQEIDCLIRALYEVKEVFG